MRLVLTLMVILMVPVKIYCNSAATTNAARGADAIVISISNSGKCIITILQVRKTYNTIFTHGITTSTADTTIVGCKP
eukprot:2509255-Ditylum_brightwellii.AAC.1